MFDILMDALCCVVCADKRLTKTEREAVHKVLIKTKAPWCREEIDNRINEFVECVKEMGLRPVIEETCRRLPEIRRMGEEALFFKCIEYMMRSDGVVDEREKGVCDKFRLAIGPTEAPGQRGTSRGKNSGLKQIAGTLEGLALCGVLVGLASSCVIFTVTKNKFVHTMWGLFMAACAACLLAMQIMKLMIKSERKEAQKCLLIVLLTIGGIAVISFLVVGPMVHRRSKYRAISEAFQSYVTEYTDIDVLNDKSYNYSPYIVGKVVIVDDLISRPKSRDYSLEIEVWKRVIPTDHIKAGPSKRINGSEFMQLPIELRAKSPEEVGTIILLRWDATLEGTYGKPYDGRGQRVIVSGAYRITCEATIIDKARNLVIDKRFFQGGPPPRTIPSKRHGVQYGSKPTKDIVNYIKSLPLRSGSDPK